MKKCIIILIAFLFCVCGIGWLRVSMSHYYEKGLGRVHFISGDLVKLPNDATHPSTETFLYPMAKNEKLTLQVKGASITTLVAVYDLMGFREYKLFQSRGGSRTFVDVDTSKTIYFTRDVLGNPLKELVRNSIFDKGGTLKYIGIQVSTSLTGDTEIQRIK